MGRPKKTQDEEGKTSPVTESRYRDEKGLLKGIEYKFVDGLVNWVALIPDKFIVAKPGFEDKAFEELQDNEKLILLGGFKHLAKIRGYSDLYYKSFTASDHFVSLACHIDWMPNFETEDLPVGFESCADAHPGSTDQMFSNFLTTIAENRAFSRCVRNFLGINILGKEEMQGAQQSMESKETNQASKSSINPNKLLADLLDEEGLTFKRLKRTMCSIGLAEAELWEGIDDISKAASYQCIERIKNRVKDQESTTPEASAPEAPTPDSVPTN